MSSVHHSKLSGSMRDMEKTKAKLKAATVGVSKQLGSDGVRGATNARFEEHRKADMEYNEAASRALSGHAAFEVSKKGSIICIQSYVRRWLVQHVYHPKAKHLAKMRNLWSLSTCFGFYTERQCRIESGKERSYHKLKARVCKVSRTIHERREDASIRGSMERGAVDRARERDTELWDGSLDGAEAEAKKYGYSFFDLFGGRTGLEVEDEAADPSTAGHMAYFTKALSLGYFVNFLRDYHLFKNEVTLKYVKALFDKESTLIDEDRYLVNARFSFRERDTQNRGELDVHDLPDLMADAGIPLITTQEAQEAMAMIDGDQDGHFSEDEFAEFWHSRQRALLAKREGKGLADHGDGTGAWHGGGGEGAGDGGGGNGEVAGGENGGGNKGKSKGKGKGGEHATALSSRGGGEKPMSQAQVLAAQARDRSWVLAQHQDYGLRQSGFEAAMAAIAVVHHPPGENCACHACGDHYRHEHGSAPTNTLRSNPEEVHGLHALQHMLRIHVYPTTQMVFETNVCGVRSLTGRNLLNEEVFSLLTGYDMCLRRLYVYYSTKEWLRLSSQLKSWDDVVLEDRKIEFVDFLRFTHDFDFFPRYVGNSVADHFQVRFFNVSRVQLLANLDSVSILSRFCYSSVSLFCLSSSSSLGLCTVITFTYFHLTFSKHRRPHCARHVRASPASRSVPHGETREPRRGQTPL